ncbi:hypothetical protein [Flammeovirga agarivorans]|uniref:Uncharacterized protein n=1 Tax=Flammeovirga agarivorans TaxID=2726742 RepID=A0A7X8XVW1_9BACT|nr:hypothetical protein [Flammeovirga agarivorans]NLR91475.1 hypothetical protein [Flammeovirga agarivorans]
MWIFIFIFFAIASAFTVLNLSVAESKKVFFTTISILMIVNLIYYPYSVEVTNQTLSNLLGRSDLVSFIALVQIFESILLIGLFVLQIKGHYKKRAKKIISWFTIFPSFIFLMGLFFLQSYCFINIEEYPFLLIAFAFALGVGVLLYLAVAFVKFILPEWDLRAELKMLTSLLQILLAMFLPLIVKGVQVPFSNLVVEVQPILVAGITVISVASIGVFLYMKRERKYYSNKNK